MSGNDEKVARPDFLSPFPREHPDQRLIQENGALRSEIEELTKQQNGHLRSLKSL